MASGWATHTDSGSSSSKIRQSNKATNTFASDLLCIYNDRREGRGWNNVVGTALFLRGILCLESDRWSVILLNLGAREGGSQPMAEQTKELSVQKGETTEAQAGGREGVVRTSLMTLIAHNSQTGSMPSRILT